MWLVVDPAREEKTRRIMRQLEEGSQRRWRITTTKPPRGEPFVVWGHLWIAEEIVPEAMARGTEWWLVDNGYYMPAKPDGSGHYSLTRNGTAPVHGLKGDPARLRVPMLPWRPNPKGYVLIALGGPNHGKMMKDPGNRVFEQTIEDRVRAIDRKRPIQFRIKGQPGVPLSEHLAGASVLITHCSKVAVEAVRAGVPVIVHPNNPAAPMGATSLDAIADPVYPEGREDWWASLMGQQFTLQEMRYPGLIQRFMARVREAVR